MIESSPHNLNKLSYDELGDKRLNSQCEQRKEQTNYGVILTSRGYNSNFLNFQSTKSDRYVNNFNQKQIYEEFDPTKMRIDIRKSLNLPYKSPISRSNNASMLKVRNYKLWCGV